MRNNKRIISFCLILIIISFSVFILNTKIAKANFIVDGGKTLIGGGLLNAQEALGTLVVLISGIGQGFLNYTNPQDGSIVEEGWKITRDLVNMFFVLILLVIALAMILKLETFGAKDVLGKLILVALLINFSLVIAGAVLDFTGVLTNFFMPDKDGFFKNIAATMRLPTVVVTNAENGGTFYQCSYTATANGQSSSISDGVRFREIQACQSHCTEDILPNGHGMAVFTSPICQEITIDPTKVDWSKIQGDKFWKVISALYISIFFTIVAAFVIGAFSFMLFVRVIIIWFLLILSPLAWFFYILPSTNSLFSKWWDKFIQWAFFAPAATFFIWLSVSSWSQFMAGRVPVTGGEAVTGMKKVIADSMTQSTIMPQVMQPNILIQFFISCGMMIGSLIAAQKLGAYGAGGVINIAKKARGWAGEKMKGAGLGTAKWAGKRAQITTANIANKAKLGERMGKAGEFIGKGKYNPLKLTGAPFLMKQMARGPRQFEEKERAAFTESEKKYKDWTTDNLKREREATNPRDKAAIDTILAKRKGGFEGLNDKEMKKRISSAKRYNKEDDIIKARPDLAHLTGKTTKEVVYSLKPKDIEHVQAEAYEENEVQEEFLEGFKDINSKLGKSILVKAGEENPGLNNILMKIVKKNIDDVKPEIKAYYNTTMGKATTE